MADQFIAQVSSDLADLIPGFLSNRKREIVALRNALAATDFEALRRIGHRMTGAGGSYGFDAISTIGTRIVKSAGAQDVDSLTNLVEMYDDYLAHVRITYEPN